MKDKVRVNMPGRDPIEVIGTKPASPVITVPDPDDSAPVIPVTTFGEVEGVVQFRTDS